MKTESEENTEPNDIQSLEYVSEERLGSMQKQFKFGEFATGHSLHVVEKVYDAFYAGERTGLGSSGSGFLGIKYEFNTGIPKTPSEIIETKKADCDELTRAAFYFAQQNGINGLEIAEMTWIDQKTGKLDGHAVLVLQPDESTKFPLLFDLTYLKRGEPLEFENIDISLGKKYAEEAKNPDFKIRYIKTVEEVEASHYVYIGFEYAQKGQTGRAVTAFERAAKLQPADFQINRDLAFAYKKNKDYEKALAQLTKVAGMKEGGKDAEVWAGIGTTSLGLGRNDGAIIALEKALEKKPEKELKEKITRDLTTLYIEKGNNELDKKDSESALEFFKKARFYSPENKLLENEIKRLERY